MSRLYVYGLATVFIVEQYRHFGWTHDGPASDSELICQGIGLVLIVLAFIYSDLKKE